MNTFKSEISISLILIVLLAALWHPFGAAMPSQMEMTLIAGLVVVFSIFASFVWRERARDEREIWHKMIAGRIAFLVGAVVLVLGIIIQSFAHRLDAYLIFALMAMILGKIIGIAYGKRKF